MIIDKDSLRKMALGFATVTEIFVYTVAGFAIGYYLDGWIKRTTPWLQVVFTLLGLIGGFYRLYKVFTRDDEPQK